MTKIIATADHQQNETAAASPLAQRASAHVCTAPQTPHDNFRIGMHISIVVALALLCFSNTLGCYFFADDFLHLQKLHRAFTSDFGIFLQSLLSPWQDRTVHLFFRPVVTISLAIDYALWSNNPFGYHLTNILLHAAASVCLYLVSLELMGNQPRRTTFALIAACLFASYPLHTEVVAWTICRVDGISTTFYLAALWLFLKASRTSSGIEGGLSVAAFAVSILSKEMAVTLPVVIATCSIFSRADERSEGRESIGKRIATAFRQSLPYWLVLAAYALLRTIVLGSLIGGYHGSAGSSLNELFFERWIASGSLVRLFYPLNGDILQSALWETALQILYGLLAVLVLLRLQNREATARSHLLGFCAAWFFISLAPALTVWHILSNLTGARFAYLASAPLCMAFALLLSPGDDGRRSRAADRLAAALSPLAIALFSICTIANNMAWMDATKQMEAIKTAITMEARRSEGKRIVILNVPVTYHGAHMFYSFDMLQALLEPPFNDVSVCDAVASVEPRYHCAVSAFNRTRLKEMAASNLYRFFEWNFERRCLEEVGAGRQTSWLSQWQAPPCTLESTSMTKGTTQCNFKIKNESGTRLQDYEFVDLEMAIAKPAVPLLAAARLVLSSSPDLAPAFGSYMPACAVPCLDGATHSYRFYMGERNEWSQAEEVDQINVIVRGGMPKTGLRAIFSGRADSVPILLADPLTLSQKRDGTHSIVGNRARLRFDTRMISGSAAALLEISQPFSMFDQLPDRMRDSKRSTHALASMHIKNRCGSFEIDGKVLSPGAWHQVRLAALNDGGDVIGYFSDPLYVSTDSGN